MALREGIPARINEECVTLPLENLQALVQNSAYVNDDGSKNQGKHWAQVVEKLKARWQGLADAKVKHDMGDLLSQILQQRISPATYLAFLRERLLQEAEEYRLGLVNQTLCPSLPARDD